MYQIEFRDKKGAKREAIVDATPSLFSLLYILETSNECKDYQIHDKGIVYMPDDFGWLLKKAVRKFEY